MSHKHVRGRPTLAGGRETLFGVRGRQNLASRWQRDANWRCRCTEGGKQVLAAGARALEAGRSTLEGGRPTEQPRPIAQ